MGHEENIYIRTTERKVNIITVSAHHCHYTGMEPPRHENDNISRSTISLTPITNSEPFLPKETHIH